MKQIYNFEQYDPPALNENMLRNEIEKRKVQKQTLLLGIAGILVQIVVLMFGWWNVETHPAITIMCWGYVLSSAVGGSLIAVVYTKKGGLVL